MSSAAVSFAMNGRRGVAESTRARILDAAAELGWSPSAPARALSRARAGAVGLLLARQVETLEMDPFFLRFLAGVERGLASTDHALLLRVLDSDGPVDPDAYARLAAQGRVDGFLLSDVELEDPRFEVLAGAGLPVVVAGRPPGPCPFPALETRHAEGLAAATAHLVERGHARIGFLGGLARYEFEQARLEAWRAELARAGLNRARSASATRPRPSPRGSPRWSARATCSPPARSPRPARAGSRFPATSPSPASTTPASPRSPRRR